MKELSAHAHLLLTANVSGAAVDMLTACSAGAAHVNVFWKGQHHHTTTRKITSFNAGCMLESMKRWRITTYSTGRTRSCVIEWRNKSMLFFIYLFLLLI